MRTVEFKRAPKLDPSEERIADMHSFLNVLNVLSGELYMIEMALEGAGNEQSMSVLDLIAEVNAIAAIIREKDAIEETLKRVQDSEATILTALSAILDGLEDADLKRELFELFSNIESIYVIVHERLGEMKARLTDPDLWVTISIGEFEKRLRDVFLAIEKNAKGRYRIHFNLARKSPNDYYIDLKVEGGIKAGTLWMPLRMIDVARDLTANARKYTQPGGKVAVAVYQTEDAMEVLIEDSGCGIPEDEIDRVVEFGYRASNVVDRTTMGGGFGLTKAAWLIDRWGGKMSISSAENNGTVIRMHVPNKAIALASEAPFIEAM